MRTTTNLTRAREIERLRLRLWVMEQSGEFLTPLWLQGFEALIKLNNYEH